ncbi:MAG TPA: cation transporter [Candidatus Faecousia faecigallinarum]|nr:cation transporter [Candidatus Faecousia faecigallinarum]
MTKRLLRRLGRQNRAAYGKLSGAVGIACNLLLFAGKLAVGLAAHSVSITADAVNNLSDASGAVVTLVGFRMAEKPADRDHPFGHARVEYIAGLVVSALILLVGAELAKSAVEKILHPAPVDISPVTMAVLAVSVAVKLWLSRFNRMLGRQIDSAALMATAADSRNDALSTGAVLLSALVSRHTGWGIDGYTGLAVALFILWSGIGIARDTVNPLLGQGADPALGQALAKMLTANPKVLGFHDLMVHDYGPGQRFATVHVEMDAREDPLLCHDIIDGLERSCLDELKVHLCIHYDPIVTDDPELNHMRQVVTDCLARLDPGLSVHDFRMVRGAARTNLIFDLVVPDSVHLDDVQQAVDQAVSRESDKYATVITFDRPAFFRSEK